MWLFSIIMYSVTVQEKPLVEKDSDLRSQFTDGPSSLLKGLILPVNSTKDHDGSNLQNPNKALGTGLKSRSCKVRDQGSREGKYNSPGCTGEEKPSSKEAFPASPLLNKHTCLGCKMKLLNFSTVSRTFWPSGELHVVSFKLAEFLLQRVAWRLWLSLGVQ